MRSSIAVVSAVAMLTAQMSAAVAQNAVSTPAQPVAFSPVKDATIRPAIVDAFDAFPKGGDLLSKRIAEIIVKDPKLAVGLVKYIQTTPGLSRDQKLAAEQGLADALNRLGIRAADMPVKAPPPPAAAAEAYDASWLLALAAIAGIICLGVCPQHHHEGQPVPISPN
jgi:hypothetical protein